MALQRVALGLTLGLALSWGVMPWRPQEPHRPDWGLIRGRAMPATFPGP